MENKPFTSQYSNVCNEALYRIVPNPYGLKNVTGTQIQNRNIYDSSTISVHANPGNPQQQQLPHEGQHSVHCPSSAPIRTMQQHIPGGVSFTFNSSPKTYGVQNVSAPNPYPSQSAPCNPRPQIINQCVHPQLHYSNEPFMANQYMMQNQTQPKNSEIGTLENMMMDQLKQTPYQVKFHYNDQTSTSDFLIAPKKIQPSMGTPDYTNLAGMVNTLRNTIESEFPIVLQKSSKFLLLTKTPDIKLTCKEIREQDQKLPKCEYVDKELQTDQRVSFEDQVENPVTKKKKKRKTNKRPKKGSRRSSTSRTKCRNVVLGPSGSSSSFSTEDDYDDQEDRYDENDRR